MRLTLHVWRQEHAKAQGRMATYQVDKVNQEMSFLEMIDVLNETLVAKNEEPIAFDYDCREGICGACSLVINGIPHGPQQGTTTCQLHMRSFKDGDEITIEPFRAKGFPVIKDLTVDRSAFDRILQAGGYVSCNSGGTQDANSILISKDHADEAFDGAACIGCGACVASCKNGSAMLFVSAKVSQLAMLPQGHPERKRRVLGMTEQMDLEGFGGCTNTLECEAVCPKEISVKHIARLNRELFKAYL